MGKAYLRRMRHAMLPVGGLGVAERMSAALKQALVALLPDLRAFARSLERDGERADDLVQETLLRALAGLHTFREGTNLGAWTFTILRNAFYSERRKQSRTVAVASTSDETAMPRPESPQESHMILRDLRSAFWRLSDESREAIVLVTMRGLKYEEAASICGCSIGTMKARVSRARARLRSSIGEHSDMSAPSQPISAQYGGAAPSDEGSDK